MYYFVYCEVHKLPGADGPNHNCLNLFGLNVVSNHLNNGLCRRNHQANIQVTESTERYLILKRRETTYILISPKNKTVGQ